MNNDQFNDQFKEVRSSTNLASPVLDKVIKVNDQAKDKHLVIIALREFSIILERAWCSNYTEEGDIIFAELKRQVNHRVAELIGNVEPE